MNMNEQMPTLETSRSEFTTNENMIVEAYTGVARKVGDILKAVTEAI